MELAKCSAKLRAGPDSSRTFAAALLGHVIDSNLDSVRVMRSGCKPQTNLKKPHSSTLFREINLSPCLWGEDQFPFDHLSLFWRYWFTNIYHTLKMIPICRTSFARVSSSHLLRYWWGSMQLSCYWASEEHENTSCWHDRMHAGIALLQYSILILYIYALFDPTCIYIYVVLDLIFGHPN